MTSVDVGRDPRDGQHDEPDRTRWGSRFERLSAFASAMIVLLGLAVFIGWLFDVTPLKRLHPSFVTMKVNTALVFILLGAGIWLMRDAELASTRVRRSLALVVILIAGLTLAQYLFGVNVGLDEIVFRDTSSPIYPGRMSPLTAVSFLLLGCALLLPDRGSLFRASQGAVLLAATGSLVALCGYLYGVRSLYSVGPYSTMALHTAVGMFAACCAFLFARPQEGVMRLLTSDTGAGHMLRRLLPAIVLAPIVIGWFRLEGQVRGLYDTSFGFALMVLSDVILLSIFTWRVVSSLDRSELHLRSAMKEIRELNDTLEHRVDERTKEVVLARERLDGIISIAADAIISTDDDQRITIFNKGAEEIFGWRRDEILGLPLDTLIPQGLRPIHREHVATFAAETAKARRMAERREVFGLRKNGEQFPAEAAISKLRQESGHIFTVIIRDISERVRVEDERQVFVSLIENSSDFIGIADPSGKPIYLNPAGRRMVGLPPDFPVERIAIQDCYPKELRSFVTDVLIKTMIEQGRWSGETFFRHWQTDEAIPVSDEHFMIRDPSGKRILGMGTVTRDISQARRAAAERDYWYSRAVELFDQAADSIFIADMDGRLTNVNAAACNMLGYAREELIGKRIVDIIPSEDAPRLAATREYLLSPGTVHVAEWTQLRKDGTPIPVEVSSKILPDGRWLAFIRNIAERKRMEEALKGSEKKFRTLAEAMPQIVWITRPDGWNVYFNQNWVTYTGLTLEQSYGHGWNIPFHPDDRQRAWDAWQDAVRTDGVYSIECRLRRADGVYRWWLIRGASLHDETGNVINWFGTCTDVEDIKQTEEALRRARDETEAANEQLRTSEERFRLIIDEAPIGMALVALDGRFVRVNRALCEIVGFTPDELTKLTFHDITHPEDLDVDVSLAGQLARGEIPRYQLGKRYIRKDGTTVETMLNGSILRDRDGAPLYYIAQVEDVTERKRDEAALRDSEQRLNLALESTQMGIWDLDLSNDTAVRSLRHDQIFGYRALLPRWGVAIFMTHVVPEDREGVKRRFEEAFASDAFNVECRILWPDKSIHWISAKGRVVTRDPSGVPTRMLGTVADITEQKQLEEERARTLKERETLLKEIHHRVKNNLQVVSSLFYLQRQRTEQEALRTLLDESRNRIQSIALIHEKLYQSEHLASIDFGDYLEDLTSRLTSAIGAQSPQAKIEIHAGEVFLDIEKAIPCALIANELVSNALKHAFPGGRRGEIHITVGWEAPGLVQLVVSDTGVGFPVDLDFKNTTSLGMQLVCSLTRQLRGTVTLSRDGGTRFAIQFAVGPQPSPRDSLAGSHTAS